MDFQTMQKRLKSANIRNVVLGSGFVFMIIANGLLAAKIYGTSNQVVLVPTSITDGMVARGAIDQRFVEAVALDAIYGLYNSSPNTLKYGRIVIERTASVNNRAKLLEIYDEVAEDIRQREISTVFRPTQIEHNLDQLEVTVKGELDTYLSNVKVATERRNILLTFVVEAGSVRLSRINRMEIEQ